MTEPLANIDVTGSTSESTSASTAASTPAGCFDAAIEACRIATRYMKPVILLTDGRNEDVNTDLEGLIAELTAGLRRGDPRAALIPQPERAGRRGKPEARVDGDTIRPGHEIEERQLDRTAAGLQGL